MNNENEQNPNLTMTVLVTPDMANFSGNAHGGQILKLLDGVAFACASRYSGKYCVTLSCDKVLFKQPVKVGSLLTFHAAVNYTGRSSMEIGVKVVCEDIRQKVKTHTNSCYFTMVALDDDKKTCEVPQLVLNTEDAKRRYNNGKKRKELRIERAKLLEERTDNTVF